MSVKAAKENIRETELAEALGERYLAYALSTIMSRSLPDVRDGLKPVHRRLLFAMRQLKLAPETAFKKCARVVGDVIGKYHPHGDVAVYEAMVRLAQDFSVRYPLVDGQGNFGSIDGDNAAAMRYTEARLTSVAWALMEGIDEDAVDFRETYDGSEQEPVILPARFPNLLANGATGIAVGMATSIPPHNVGELCDALLHLIKFPKATFEKLAEMIPGPDFPTGGVLVEPSDLIIAAYRSGRGGFRLRARWEIEKLSHGQYQVIITEIPYQTQKSKIIERIAQLLEERKLPLLANISDESDANLRIVLEPKNRTVEPEMLMEQLFRQTDLDTRFVLNLNLLDANNMPCLMSLREALVAFLDHRHVVLNRRSRHRLQNIQRRLEILAGFLIAYLNLDQIIAIIREADEPKPALMRKFKLSDNQAEAILNMRLRQLRRLEEVEIKKENAILTAEMKDLKSLLGDEKRRWKAIALEIAETKKQFASDKRRTLIGKPPTAISQPIEAMIEREPITILCSEKGWIRAVKGHLADLADIKYKEGDRARFIAFAQTTDKITMMATNGRFYTIVCGKLPGGRGHGEPVRLLVDLADGHDLVAMFVHQPGRRFIVASDKGYGFIVEGDEVIAQTRNGKQILNLGDAEEAAAARLINDGDDAVAAIGECGKLLVFPLAELPVMARGRGVIMQRYASGGLSDVKTFKLKDGLSWETGRGVSAHNDIKEYKGKRAQAGRMPPKGFPRNYRFSV